MEMIGFSTLVRASARLVGAALFGTVRLALIAVLGTVAPILGLLLSLASGVLLLTAVVFAGAAPEVNAPWQAMLASAAGCAALRVALDWTLQTLIRR